MILKSDHIIDVGPYAGKQGGDIIFSGNKKELLSCNSLTAQYINNTKQIEAAENHRPGNGKFIELKGCTGNNLKNIDLKIPLNTLTIITGVSGSGKSTLINETLFPVLHNKIYRAEKTALSYKSIKGLENIDKIVNINQSPIVEP